MSSGPKLAQLSPIMHSYWGLRSCIEIRTKAAHVCPSVFVAKLGTVGAKIASAQIGRRAALPISLRLTHVPIL